MEIATWSLSGLSDSLSRTQRRRKRLIIKADPIYQFLLENQIRANLPFKSDLICVKEPGPALLGRQSLCSLAGNRDKDISGAGSAALRPRLPGLEANLF